MGIHQALIGGYPDSELNNWQIRIYNSGPLSNFTFNSLRFAPNEIVFFCYGSDFSTVSFSSTLATTTLFDQGIALMWNFCAYGVIPPTPVNFNVSASANYGIVFGLRRPVSSQNYNVSVEATNTTSAQPSHNNTPVAFTGGTDLALLLAFVDDLSTVMGQPTNSSFITRNGSSNRGTVASAYKQIDADGNYSWGSWNTSNTQFGTSAYVIKVQSA